MRRTLICLAIGLFLLTPSVAVAASGRTGETVTVPTGDTLSDDLYAVAATVTISGTVTGDVVALGQTITIEGTVNGSVWVAGSTVRITGTVNGTVRAAGSTVTVTGNVKGDVIAVGSEVSVGPSAAIGRDVLLAGSRTSVAGRIGRDVKLRGSQTTVGGSVAGAVDIASDSAPRFTADARVAEAVKYSSEAEAIKDPGAVLAGPVTFESKEQKAKQQDQSYADRLAGQWYWFLASLVLLLSILLYARRAAVVARDAVLQRPGWAAAAGLGFLVAVPLALLLLIVILVGIPLAMFGAMLGVLVVYTAKIFVALAIGGILLRQKPGEDPGFLRGLGAGVVGLALIYLLYAVPSVGWFAKALVTLLGVGAQVLLAQALYRDTRQKYGS